MTPTQRTLGALRDDGYMVGIVERFITAGRNRAFGNRVDLFGMFDLLAVCPFRDKPSERTIGVQVFTTAWSEHEKKLITLQEEDGRVGKWMECGHGIELWGWRKLKVKRGGKAVRWTPKIKIVLIQNGSLSFQEIDWL